MMEKDIKNTVLHSKGILIGRYLVCYNKLLNTLHETHYC